MRYLVIVLLFLLASVTSIDARQDTEWLSMLKRIKVLETSLDEIIKLYGNPNEEMFGVREFETAKGTLTVKISTGRCGTSFKKGWDVESNVVESFTFEVKRRLKLASLGLDMSNFEKSEVFDQPGAYYYESTKLGMDIFVNKGGHVELLEFYPDEALASKIKYCG